MSGAVPPLPQYACMAWCSVRGSTGTILPLPFCHMFMAFNYLSGNIREGNMNIVWVKTNYWYSLNSCLENEFGVIQFITS
jgi:hypothetical protein